MWLLALALHGLTGVVVAQTFDAQGPQLPPDGGSVRDPVLGYGGHHPGAPVVSLLGMAASDLLVQRITDGDHVVDTPLLDDLFGAQVSAIGALGPRFAIGATLPVWFSSGGLAGGGFAMGDATLWAPIRVLGRERERLAVVPFGTFPTGAAARYLGTPGVTVGALVSGGLDRGPFTAHLDLGLDGTAATGSASWPGGLHGRAVADVGLAPVEVFGVHLELRSRAPLFRPLHSVPTEAMLTVKGRPDERVWLTAGAGRALTRGIGAPGLRMMVGIQAALGKQDVVAPVITGAADTRDLRVTDERGFPLDGARVLVGGSTVQTDHEGFAAVPVRALREGELLIEHEGFEPLKLPVSEDELWWEVALRRLPVPVAVSVVGPQGMLELVDVRISGPQDVPDPRVDDVGVHHYALRAGTWTIEMSSPGYGKQERTLIIEPTRTEPLRVDAVLTDLIDDTRLRIQVVDALGQPVEDAVVAVEGRDLGTTGTGGDLIIEGLEKGEHALVVRSSRHGEGRVLKVVVGDGDQTVRATLDWQPGSVQVRVSDSVGLPMDATVRFEGPAQLPARNLGSDGEELFVLRPGSWDVVVSAEGAGTQSRRIEVSDRPGELISLAFRLLTDEGGPVDLDLRVVDVDGRPLPGVDVALDGKPLGRTGPSGTLGLEGLDMGLRQVDLSGELLIASQAELALVPGHQRHDLVLGWVDGVTDLHVVDADGRPLDARVTLVGPTEPDPIQLGRDGTERVVLLPGRWTLSFSHGDLGVQSRELLIEPGLRRRHDVQVQLFPVAEVANLDVRIVTPEGQPLSGALVEIDEIPVGQAVGGEIRAQGLALGQRWIEVTHEAMLPVSVAVDVADASEAVDVPMAWKPGALKVQVATPDGDPVDATVMVMGDTRVTARAAVGGETVIGLDPGKWVVVAEAPGYGVQQVEIDLPEEPGLTTVPIALEPARPEDRKMVIRAETPDGLALTDAEVVVNGVVVGTTGTGGVLEITDLPAPPRQDKRPARTVTGKVDTLELPEVELSVEVRPPAEVADSLEAVTIPVMPGQVRHTVVVPHKEQSVAVVVQDAAGQPVQAEIVAVGPREEAPVAAQGGQATLELAPGAWTVTARTPDGAVATQQIVVRPTEAPEISLVVEGVQSRIDADRVVPVQPILFDLDQHTLRPDALPLLDDLARWLQANQPAALVEVAGHTDDQGGVTYNQQLSERRAHAVKQALMARGIAPERLVARGYGLTRPVTPLTDDESRQRNRRVELVVRQWSRTP